MYNGRNGNTNNAQATLMRLGKRASVMSVNQDLHALADVYRGGHVGNAEATLMRLGKRAPGKLDKGLEQQNTDICLKNT